MPKKTSARRDDHVLFLRLGASDKRMLLTAARRARLPLTAWARSVLIREVSRARRA